MNQRFEIVSDFSIGLSASLKNSSANTIYQTKKVIDCSKDIGFLGAYKDYLNQEHKQRIYQQEIVQFQSYILATCETIYQSILRDQPIFVCCKDCTQISPTIAVVFLIKYASMSLRDALRVVLSKVSTPVFQPNIEYFSIIESLS